MKDQSARILIIEDEAPLRIGLADSLTAEGHRVLTAEEGEQGLQKALSEKPDLILLDIMMPGLDGFALCQELRRRGEQTLVLMLTARGLVADRVRGLDSGADDYLVKPFSLGELHARVRALLRRLETGKSAPRTLTLSEVTIDFTQQRVHRGPREISLTRKEFGMLALLASRLGQPVSREDFFDQVWSYGSYPTTRTVDNHLASLRKKLEPNPRQPRHLLTVPGQGYRLQP
ncbi:response regulator transcription factor [Roseibacillus ishigakijimensis]|uniref:Response regulator transcription factor n=1 Tax=Roseibacillus ishigakijimensis TaxID=454146 RepID=A0A934VLI7_9BACT|nr:response regulator transcription factor [Roseibacillus ishigakijimensis]MBK1833282.1 response regulator transcription factor [Roseibacillus ishigakijimensis]